MKITIGFEINDDEEKARLVVLLQAMRCVLIRITAFVHLPESEIIPCCRRTVETMPQGQALSSAGDAGPLPHTQHLPAAAPQETQASLDHILSRLLPPAQSMLQVCHSTGA